MLFSFATGSPYDTTRPVTLFAHQFSSNITASIVLSPSLHLSPKSHFTFSPYSLCCKLSRTVTPRVTDCAPSLKMLVKCKNFCFFFQQIGLEINVDHTTILHSLFVNKIYFTSILIQNNISDYLVVEKAFFFGNFLKYKLPACAQLLYWDTSPLIWKKDSIPLAPGCSERRPRRAAGRPRRAQAGGVSLEPGPEPGRV